MFFSCWRTKTFICTFIFSSQKVCNIRIHNLQHLWTYKNKKNTSFVENINITSLHCLLDWEFCTGRQICAKQQQHLQQSEASRSKQEARWDYWLMHLTKGPTYSTYCDWAAWHDWAGSGISPIGCRHGSFGSQPSIWPPRILDLRFWGTAVRGQPQALAL